MENKQKKAVFSLCNTSIFKKNKDERNKLIRDISPCIFWDVDISKLDADKHKDLIMARVYSRGYEKDEMTLWKIYTINDIKKTVVKLEELNERALSYLSCILNIKERKFKCYKKKPYHLNYLKE